MLRLYPQAHIYTHVLHRPVLSRALREADIRTTFVDDMPAARRLYPFYLPAMPFALEALDLSGYDLVISSESGPAKGVLPPPEARHLSYVHTPMRYLWDQRRTYRAATPPLVRGALPLAQNWLRTWDVASAARVDRFVANSAFVSRRIESYWRRESRVVHPPVDGAPFEAAAREASVGEGFVWVGQLVPYKRADLAVAAFNRLGLPLTIVGGGPERRRLARMAGPTIRFVDHLPRDDLARLCAGARALVFSGKEDFGMVPVEAMAAGRPVLAFGGGGALETVQDGITGLFFAEQTAESLIDGVERLNAWLPHFDPAAAQARARRFAPEVFDHGFTQAVEVMLSGGLDSR